MSGEKNDMNNALIQTKLTPKIGGYFFSLVIGGTL